MASNSSVTPPVSAIPGIDSQIGSLNNQAGSIRSELNSSSTAFGDSNPSSNDISNQQALEKIQTTIKSLNDQKLRAQWYPPTVANSTTDVAGEGAVDPGIIGNTLDFLSRPVRGVVGAVKHFTGQGTGSLLNDVAENMTTGKEYFGDVLAKAGAPGWLSAPLGFGLDIALDPINWATMGEAALVPKIAGGLVRGGVEGASLAAKAGVLEKAVTAGKYIPGFGTAFGEGTQAFASLGRKALAATGDYESATGNTLEKLLSGPAGAGFGSSRVPLSTIIEKVAGAIPGGEKALETLVYDPVGWVRQTVDMDIIKRAFGTQGVVDINGALKAQQEGKSIESFLAPIKDIVENTPKGSPNETLRSMFGAEANTMTQSEADTARALLPPAIAAKIPSLAPDFVSRVDDVASINKDPFIGVTNDPMANGLRILNETGFGGGNLTMQDVADIVNSGALGDTGVKWFDNMMKGINDFGAKVDENGKRIGGIGQSTLQYYDRFMALFRGAKVGASPVGHMNAVFGNAIMNHLGIGDIGPDYWSRYNQIRQLYSNVGGSAAKLQGEFMNAGLHQVLEDMKMMPTAVRDTFGDAAGFVDADKLARMMLQNLVSEAGRVTQFNSAGLTAEQLAPYMEAGYKDLEGMRSALPAEADRGVLGGTSVVRKMYADKAAAEAAGKSVSELSRSDVPTDMVSQELFGKPAGAEMFAAIAKKAEENPGNPFWKVMDLVYNKMTNTYAKHDQVAKMTTFVRATMDGYTLPQMLKARNLIDIGAEDFSKIQVDGVNRYRLSTRKGIELANALYMNYAAMPSAVRVLRNMPIVGSPFASFMYGMALKTGQTLAYNPSAFNKVNFALNEFGGTATPLEKRALNTPFYSYLKQPGMYRVPFTDANPIYLNLSNLIPYYSMNMFNPSQQKYTVNNLSTAFAQAVDASPFLKEPLGATLFNNVIQPAILSEGIQPQGQFGQAIWPSDADFLTKLGYTSRDLAEAVVPGVASYAGLAGGLAAPAATPFVPLYRYRTLANAVQGNNAYGISGKESIPSRTLRGVLSASGIPVQAPVNTTFTPKSNGQ